MKEIAVVNDGEREGTSRLCGGHQHTHRMSFDVGSSVFRNRRIVRLELLVNNAKFSQLRIRDKRWIRPLLDRLLLGCFVPRSPLRPLRKLHHHPCLSIDSPMLRSSGVSTI
jgi:hypothetical protein